MKLLTLSSSLVAAALLLTACGESIIGPGDLEDTDTLYKGMLYEDGNYTLQFYIPSDAFFDDETTEGKPSSVTILEIPQNGTLNVTPEHDYIYTPNKDYFGSDVMKLSVYDSSTSITTIYTQPFEVLPVNDAPVISGTPTTSIDLGQEYTFLPNVTDIDNAPEDFTFSISEKPYWADFNVTTGALTGTAEGEGGAVYSDIVISVSDGNDTVSLPPFSITVHGDGTGGGAPVTEFVDVSTSTIQEDTSSTYAYENDGGSYTYSIYTYPTHGAVGVGGSSSTYTPFENYYGEDSYQLKRTDTAAGTAVVYTIPINVLPVNDAPEISGIPTTRVEVNDNYAFTPLVTDVDNSPEELTFSISNKPSWASFDVIDGSLTGTVPSDASGKTYYGVTISVDDGDKITSLPSFDIIVDVTAP
ncbi:MAG: hypothetical protein IE916_00430 [Epsilonproteobacteria bacterium]|nr:hypothetical protein [Campylobacterota bacterium]